jgi:hypothetical protein
MMRAVMQFVAFAALASFVAGCTSNQLGPRRPIAIDDDVAWSKPLAMPELANFYSVAPAVQAGMRNEILTARMYIADMEYHYYEARLTREMQNEGLLATATSLGLTTAATLVSPAQTKTILAGIATAVTGLDKAYIEKELLSNAMQALQTQMRADRKGQAAVIYAKMFKGPSIITPITEYTLPMALSDADSYYQAGTMASALIGLSKTVANAEQRAERAKSESGPNPGAVSSAREIAAPPPGGSVVPTLRISNVARDRSYADLRSLLLPNGATRVDPVLEAYVRSLLGNDKIAIGVILNNAQYATLRQRLSACIISRASGSPCTAGSLSALVR